MSKVLFDTSCLYWRTNAHITEARSNNQAANEGLIVLPEPVTLVVPVTVITVVDCGLTSGFAQKINAHKPDNAVRVMYGLLEQFLLDGKTRIRGLLWFE